MTDIVERLKAHFPPNLISWRVGATNKDKSKGMALAYIDARDVMGRFDEVCGPFGWQNEHVAGADGKKLTCRIGVRNPETGEWIWKSDGAGETDVEGEKGSYSDSLKRAAVVWGVGRYLYEVESPWVQLEAKGHSYVIAPSEVGRLRDLLFRMNKALGGKNDQPDPREAACNRIIGELRDSRTEQELVDTWKRSQGEIVVMSSEQMAAVTKAKDEMKTALSRRAA